MHRVVGTLLAGFLAVSAGALELDFMSVLSAPVGSFTLVETGSADPVHVDDTGAQVNLGYECPTAQGCAAPSYGGSITLHTKPMSVDTLKLEKDATFKMGGLRPPVWQVESLTIGNHASVTVGQLLAGTITVEGKLDKDTEFLRVTDTLKANGPVYVNKLAANQKVEMGNFTFQRNNTEPATLQTAHVKEVTLNTQNGSSVKKKLVTTLP